MHTNKFSFLQTAYNIFIQKFIFDLHKTEMLFTSFLINDSAAWTNVLSYLCLFDTLIGLKIEKKD